MGAKTALEHAIESFLALTGAIVGLSHLLRPTDWSATFRQLHACGRVGAFANGAISLAPGAIIVSGQNVWNWPGIVLTIFGWLMVLKGLICFLTPDQALRSLEHGSCSPKSFVAGGVVMLAMAAWAGYCWGRAG
jgi:hypothetical protein